MALSCPPPITPLGPCTCSTRAMFFYLVLGALFTIYALDLLLLVIVAAVARAKEAVMVLRRYHRAQ